MSSLRRDLLERKLWILVALLGVCVVAVPVLLLKHGTASGTVLPPAPPSAAATTATTATTASPTTTTGQESPKVILAQIARDPFASGVHQLSAKPASSTTSSAGSSSSAASTSGSGSTTSTVAMVTPSPATTGASSSSASTGSSSATSGATPTSTIASASPTTVTATPGQVRSWTIYSVSLRFTRNGKGPVHGDVARLTALPSAGDPQLMFYGVLPGGHQAVLGLNAGVVHAGPGLCRPSRSSCSAIVLGAGEGEEVAWPTATGGEMQGMIRVVKITSTITHSHAEALKAYNRVSESGVCDLSLSQPVVYNPDTGTVQNFPKDACKGQATSAPFAFFKTTP